MLDKKKVLENSNFGQRVAEEEVPNLTSYFVETDQWKRMLLGEIDVVYGPKGSGKSAIYSLLLSQPEILKKRGIFVIPAENPRGTTVFSDIVPDPPTSEREFDGVWKLYFLSLVASFLREKEISNIPIKKVVTELETAGLLRRGASLQAKLRSAYEYIKQLIRVESIEGGLHIDPITGLPKGLSGKITLREPTEADFSMGAVSIDQMFAYLGEGLISKKLQVWIAIDRLDVAFAENSDLEENALRALFKVYLDLLSVEPICLKIFLRSDIWKRLTQKGFREASHIIKHVTISWSPQLLLNLVIRRAVRNEALRQFYGVEEQTIVTSQNEQDKFFYKIFPQQVDIGAKKPKTFDWMLSRTQDGTGLTAPRELIHLLNTAREVQLKKYEVGESDPDNSYLFLRSSLKEALPEVSKVRLEQTLYAEYPKLKHHIQKLEREKTEHTIQTLAGIWKVTLGDADALANELVDVGFFERRGPKELPGFWVPFLYRDALELVQGTAE